MGTVLRRLIIALLPLALAGPVAWTAPEVAEASPAAHCQRTLPAYPILHLGDRGPAVRTLQCSLNDVGVGPVVVDGYYGRQTRRAVWRIVKHFEGGPPQHPFRINNGMWTLLFAGQLPHHRLQLGDSGHAVTVLQRALRAAGADIVVDGDFGAQTRGVVVRYQKEHDIHPADGRVTGDTRFILAMGGVFGALS
jgi:peptidoglycan hydrolase-like protein with peptidoglycan-binding domain